MPTAAERLATLEAKFEDLEKRIEAKFGDLEKRMDRNGSWVRFLIAQAIQAVLLGATVIAALAAWKR